MILSSLIVAMLAAFCVAGELNPRGENELLDRLSNVETELSKFKADQGELRKSTGPDGRSDVAVNRFFDPHAAATTHAIQLDIIALKNGVSSEKSGISGVKIELIGVKNEMSSLKRLS